MTTAVQRSALDSTSGKAPAYSTYRVIRKSNTQNSHLSFSDIGRLHEAFFPPGESPFRVGARHPLFRVASSGRTYGGRHLRQALARNGRGGVSVCAKSGCGRSVRHTVFQLALNVCPCWPDARHLCASTSTRRNENR